MNINSYYSTELLVRERTNDLLRTAERRRLLRAARLARKFDRKAALRRTRRTVVQAVAPAEVSTVVRDAASVGRSDAATAAPVERQEQPVG